MIESLGQFIISMFAMIAFAGFVLLLFLFAMWFLDVLFSFFSLFT